MRIISNRYVKMQRSSHAMSPLHLFYSISTASDVAASSVRTLLDSASYRETRCCVSLTVRRFELRYRGLKALRAPSKPSSPARADTVISRAEAYVAQDIVDQTTLSDALSIHLERVVTSLVEANDQVVP